MDLPISAWKTFDTLYALESFGDYWVENERLVLEAVEAAEVRHGPKWKPRTHEELGEFHMERNNARHLHDEIVLPAFRYSSLVMLFTIAERELLRLARNLESERVTPNPKFENKRGSLLKPVENHCKIHFDLRLQDCPEYNGLCDLQKVRDCIVHCHGEVRLSRDAKYLVDMNQRRVGFSAHIGTTIEIGSDCTKQFLNEAWRFFLWVFNQRKWPVDDLWLNKKWG